VSDCACGDQPPVFVDDGEAKGRLAGGLADEFQGRGGREGGRKFVKAEKDTQISYSDRTSSPLPPSLPPYLQIDPVRRGGASPLFVRRAHGQAFLHPTVG